MFTYHRYKSIDEMLIIPQIPRCIESEIIFFCILLKNHHTENVSKVVHLNEIYILCHILILLYNYPLLRKPKKKV